MTTNYAIFQDIFKFQEKEEKNITAVSVLVAQNPEGQWPAGELTGSGATASSNDDQKTLSEEAISRSKSFRKKGSKAK